MEHAEHNENNICYVYVNPLHPVLLAASIYDLSEQVDMQEAGTGWLVCFVTRIRLRDQLLFIWAAEESACIILCTRLENNEMKWINME